MVRLRGSVREKFYKRLHELEEIKEETWAESIRDVNSNWGAKVPRYGLDGYTAESEEILELRMLLGINNQTIIKRKQKFDYVPEEKIDFLKLNRKQRSLGYSNSYISKKLGYHPTTFSNRLKHKKITYAQLSKIEDILKLKKGSLLLQ